MKQIIAIQFAFLALAGSSLAKGSTPAIKVTDFKVQMEIGKYGRDKGKVNPRFEMNVTKNAAISKGNMLELKATCDVGGRRMTQKQWLMAVKLSDMSPGETSAANCSPFIMANLEAMPASCDIVVTAGKMFGGGAKTVASYCWRPTSVTDGPCSKK